MERHCPHCHKSTYREAPFSSSVVLCFCDNAECGRSFIAAVNGAPWRVSGPHATTDGEKADLGVCTSQI